jgi:hypothetical protein
MCLVLLSWHSQVTQQNQGGDGGEENAGELNLLGLKEMKSESKQGLVRARNSNWAHKHKFLI